MSIGQVVSVVAGKLDAGENTNGEAVKNVAFTLLACLVPVAAASRAKPRRLLARKGGREARVSEAEARFSPLCERSHPRRGVSLGPGRAK